MRKVLILAVLAALAMPAMPEVAWAADESCITIASSAWGTQCDGDSNSLEITLKNTCRETLTVNFCMSDRLGKWKCDRADRLAQDATHNFWTCNATGQYKVQACEQERDCREYPVK